MSKNTFIKLLFTLTLTGILTIGASQTVLAQPNGYIVNDTEYLFSDVAANPSIIAIINDAYGRNLNNLALDLNGRMANYGAYIASLAGTKTSLDSFNAFAQNNPYMLPLPIPVYNQYDPGSLHN